MPRSLLGGHALLLAHELVQEQQARGGGVDRHRRRHLVQGDAVEGGAHVVDRVDRHAGAPDLAEAAGVVGVQAQLGGQVEGHRETGGALGEQVPVAPVGLLRGGVAGVLAHRPQLAAVHLAVHAAGVGVLTRLAELELRGEVRLGVQRGDLDPGVGEAAGVFGSDDGGDGEALGLVPGAPTGTARGGGHWLDDTGSRDERVPAVVVDLLCPLLARSTGTAHLDAAGRVGDVLWQRLPVVVGFGASRLPFATLVRHKGFEVQTNGSLAGSRSEENEMKPKMNLIRISATASTLAAVLVAALAFGLTAVPSASAAACRIAKSTAEATYKLRDGTTLTCESDLSDIFFIWQYVRAEPMTGVGRSGGYECMKVPANETGFWKNNTCTERGSSSENEYVWGVSTAKGPWEKCAEGKEKEAPTKYTTSQCTTAASGNEGKWQWNEATENEIKGVGLTLTLTDTKAPGGSSKIRCAKLEATGKVGGGASGVIETAEVSSPSTSCTRLEGACKAGEVEAVKGIHLPWHTFWTENGKGPLILIESDGSGQPGWEVDCNTVIGKRADTCETESTEKSEEATLANVSSGGVLSVSATLATKYKAKCSEGGKESGEEEGTITLLDKAGAGLRVA